MAVSDSPAVQLDKWLEEEAAAMGSAVRGTTGENQAEPVLQAGTARLDPFAAFACLSRTIAIEPSWSQFQSDLHEVERLLRNVMAREAFRGHCLPDDRRVLDLEENLRMFWDKNKFVQNTQGRDSDQGFSLVIGVQNSIGVLRSSSFWGLVKVTADLGYLAEFPGRWSEGCKCCSAHRLVYASSSRRERLLLPTPPDCIYRGCRSAELASGEFWEAMENVARVMEPRLLSYMHEFEGSGGMSTIVAKDWQRSIAYIMMGVERLAAGKAIVSRLLDEEEPDSATASFVHRVAALGRVSTVERNMLGMRSDAWHDKSVSEVLALVYRDDVRVKHASKARLKDELSSNTQLLHDPAGRVERVAIQLLNESETCQGKSASQTVFGIAWLKKMNKRSEDDLSAAALLRAVSDIEVWRAEPQMQYILLDKGKKLMAAEGCVLPGCKLQTHMVARCESYGTALCHP
ncbi:unnamed protein product [Symbiodinium sp. CCMP2592]|nr:unnamed protein product [Symbiodinium sp. CCMP2592]